MSVEDFRRIAIADLRTRKNDLIKFVIAQRHHGAAMSEISPGTAGVIPPSTMESIGAMTVQSNASIREIDEAIKIIETAFKKLTAPTTDSGTDVPAEEMY